MKTEIDLLIKTRELLATGWTRGVWARDKNDNEVPISGSKAVCFCLEGAIVRARRDFGPLPEYGDLNGMALNIALKQAGIISIIDWNDDPRRTQSEVLALIDRAIEIAEAEQ